MINSLSIRTQCRQCGLPFSSQLTLDQQDLPCTNCGHSRNLNWHTYDSEQPEAVPNCIVCGCKHLYRQRDLNRAIGCLVVVIAVILTPWTYGLSLVVAAAIDWWLWFRLKERPVCYRCDTVYRNARPSNRQKEFDLLRHDVLKYGKAWEEAD